MIMMRNALQTDSLFHSSKPDHGFEDPQSWPRRYRPWPWGCSVILSTNRHIINISKSYNTNHKVAFALRILALKGLVNDNINIAIGQHNSSQFTAAKISVNRWVVSDKYQHFRFNKYLIHKNNRFMFVLDVKF